MIRIFESGDAALLEPLTCRRAPLEIQVAGTTLKGALERRWNEFFELAPLLAEKRLSAAADFWPSHGLIEILARGNGNFTLKADGRPVAWLSEGDEADANAVTVTPDEKSFRIVYPWHILSVNEDLLGSIRESRIALGCVATYCRVPVSGVENADYYYSTYSSAPDEVTENAETTKPMLMIRSADAPTVTVSGFWVNNPISTPGTARQTSMPAAMIPPHMHSTMR